MPALTRRTPRSPRLVTATVAVAFAGALLAGACGSDDESRPVAAAADAAHAETDTDAPGGPEHPLCAFWADEAATVRDAEAGPSIDDERAALVEAMSVWRRAAAVAPTHLVDELTLVTDAAEAFVEEVDRVGALEAVDLEALDERFPGAADAEYAIEDWIDTECLGFSGGAAAPTTVIGAD